MDAIIEKLKFGDLLRVPGWLVAKPEVVGCIINLDSSSLCRMTVQFFHGTLTSLDNGMGLKVKEKITNLRLRR